MQDRHVHILYIPFFVLRYLFTFSIIVFAILAGLLSEGEDGTSKDLIVFIFGGYRLFILAFLGILILVGAALTVLAYFSYKKLIWSLGDRDFHLYKGVFFRKESHLPYSRIHSINFKSNVPQRIFGLTTMSIETAGGAEDSDAKLPYISLSDAELLKKEIFKKKKEVALGEADGETGDRRENFMSSLDRASEGLRGVFAGDYEDDELVSAEYRLKNKELVLLSLTDSKALIFIPLVLGLYYNIIQYVSIFSRDLPDQIEDYAVNTIINAGILLIVIGIIFIILVSFAISVLIMLVTFGSFSVRRKGKRIEVARGLVSRKSSTISVDRIQSIRLEKEVIHRILSYVKISIETASMPADKEEVNVVIHPFIKESDLDDFMGKMLPEHAGLPIAELAPLSKTARNRSMRRYPMFAFFFLIVPLAAIYLIINTEFAALHTDVIIYTILVLLIAFMFLGWAAWKGRAYGQNKAYIAMRKGVINRKSVFVPRQKIQMGTLSQSIFQRPKDLYTISVATAARGKSREKLKDLEMEMAFDFMGMVSYE